MRQRGAGFQGYNTLNAILFRVIVMQRITTNMADKLRNIVRLALCMKTLLKPIKQTCERLPLPIPCSDPQTKNSRQIDAQPLPQVINKRSAASNIAASNCINDVRNQQRRARL